MSWIQFSHEFRRDPIVKGAPEALVVLIDDLGAPATRLAPLAGRWATAVPTTAFFALDVTAQPDPPPCAPSVRAMLGPDACIEQTVVDRGARHLACMLRRRLSFYRLDAQQLVLAGFGYGGTLALHMTLRQGWACAGVLAFTGDVARPVTRGLRPASKIRLIECMGDGRKTNHSLHDEMTLLASRGIDTRGVSLPGSFLSDEATRHGTAYLLELIAATRCRDACSLEQESTYA